MASSPRRATNATAGNSQPSTQPLTPPADAPTSNNPQTTTSGNMASNTATAPSPPQAPATSLDDTGKSRRPRDARLIHMLLASMGVTSYQERVPLQLLDFAYRYSSSTLQDTVYLATEGYPGESTNARSGGEGGGGKGGQDPNISLNTLRMSIASRLHYQFQSGMPKEFLMDLAAERNRILLPGVTRGGVDPSASANANANAAPTPVVGGVRLPPERFCMTGVGWGLREEWESEGEEDMEVDSGSKQGDQASDAEHQEGQVGEEDVDGTMEDVFGDEGSGENGEDEDKAMTGV